MHWSCTSREQKLCFLKQGEHGSNCTILYPKDMRGYKQNTGDQTTPVWEERDKRKRKFSCIVTYLSYPKRFGCNQVNLNPFWLKNCLKPHLQSAHLLLTPIPFNMAIIKIEIISSSCTPATTKRTKSCSAIIWNSMLNAGLREQIIGVFQSSQGFVLYRKWVSKEGMSGGKMKWDRWRRNIYKKYI